MSQYRLIITRTDELPAQTSAGAVTVSPAVTIYVHDIENEADAHRLIHELTRPKRVYRQRAGKSAS